MTEEEIAELLQALAQGSVLVSGRGKVKASRDPEDDKFLAAAVEAEARFVVTGDRDLLDLKSYRRVRIVRPARFLRIIRRTSSRKS
jgi:predicted nucleic acid-binding protein